MKKIYGFFVMGVLSATASATYLFAAEVAAPVSVETPIRAFHKRGVRDITYSPDGKQLASVGDDRKVILWDAATGKIIHEMWGQHDRNINLVVFSPNGKILVATSLDEAVTVWDVATGKLIQKLLSPKGNPEWLKIAPDNSSFTFATQEGTINIVPLKWPQ